MVAEDMPLKAEMEGTPVPPTWEADIDTTTWGRILDIEEEENLTPSRLTGHILMWMELWKEEDPRTTWTAYHDQFEDWEQDTWKLLPSRIIKDLRNFLIGHGVYVPYDGARITKNLEGVAKATSFHNWTEEEI